MDSKRFDALTRGFGAHRSRRDALMGFAAGLLGLGVAKGTSAQVGAERATCGQSCGSSADCNAGLRCSGGVCVRIPDSGSSCNRNINCSGNLEVCRNGRCVNQSTCTRCGASSDCPSGEICRRGNCSGCTRDRQCGRNEICRNGRCDRDRDACRRNRDCRKKERCKNGRCKRRRRRNR